MKQVNWKAVSIFLLLLLLFQSAYLYRIERRNNLSKTESSPSRLQALRMFDPNEDWRSFNQQFLKDLEQSPDENNQVFSFNTFTNQTPLFSEPQREEKPNEIWLVFDTKGHARGNYSVNVESGQVMITAKDDSQPDSSSGGGVEQHFSQSQSFPVPEGADPNSFKISRTDEKLTVVFKKRKSGEPAEADDSTI